MTLLPADRGHLPASIMVALAIFSAIVASHLPGPLYAVYQERWGFSSMEVTALYAAYCLAVLATLLLVGPVCDRLTRRQAIIPGLLVVAAGAALLAWAPGPVWLYAGRVLSGIGTGCLSGAATAALVELDPRGRRARGAALATIMLTAGGAFGPGLSALALSLGLWPTHLPFLVVVALTLSVALGLARVPWPAHAQRQFQPLRLREWRPRRVAVPAEILAPFLLAAGAISLAWASGSVLASLGPGMATDLLGVRDRGVAGLVTVGLQVVGGLAQVAFAGTAPRRSLLLGPALLSLGLLIASVAFGLGSAPTLGLAIVVFAIGYGAAFVGSVGAVGAVAPEGQRGEVMSAIYVAAYLAASVPVIGAGAVIDALGVQGGMAALTAVAAVIAVAVMVGSQRVFRRSRVAAPATSSAGG